MAGVFHCSPTNSTHFTRCCKTAICDNQRLCPKCSKPVFPHYHEYGEDKDEDNYTDHYRHVARHRQAMRKGH